ncbi:MAG: hypothetical protein K6E29_07145 [Cyanobacteria bacterium RUI128]|nr:hypothetical protein [Cyanobacteria bacterium RUI128]
MENEKEIKTESTKPYEKLAALFGTTPEELIKIANKTADDNIVLKEDFAELLSCLEPKERDILMLRFGINDGRKRTLDEVGVYFGVDRDRIRQIEASALKKLKQHFENK